MASIDVSSLPDQLRWQDVDPAVWIVGVDELRARALALATDAFMDTPRGAPRPAPKKGKTPPAPDWKPAAERAIALSFAQTFGPWASGWRWARDEGSLGGGVVSSWCCPAHSISADVDATAKKAAAALVEWRLWIEMLRDHFEALPPRIGDEARHFVTARAALGVADDDGWRETSLRMGLDRAAAELVAVVVEASGAGDAWYAHMQQVLSWYLQFHGADDDHADRAARDAIAGRFESWIGPNDATLNAVRADWTKSGARALLRRRR